MLPIRPSPPLPAPLNFLNFKNNNNNDLLNHPTILFRP